MLRCLPSTLAGFLTVALASAVAASEPACNPIRGAEALLRPGAMILLGELHGTAEAPRVVELVCEAIAGGRNVIVGLELAQAEQGNAAAFMTSEGTPSDRQKLLAGAIFLAATPARCRP